VVQKVLYPKRLEEESGLEMRHPLQSGIRRDLFWRSLWAGGLLALLGLTSEAAPLRYVFLVETSAAMRAHKQEVLDALRVELAGGLQGRMQSGDMFVVWTYDQSVATDRYLAAPWNNRTKEILAMRTVRALDQLWFSGEARLDKALDQVQRLVNQSDSLTVVIVNSGNTPVTGTSFDAQINAAYVRGVREGNASVFVTMLMASGRKVAGWSVESVRSPQRAAPLADTPAQAKPPAQTHKSGLAEQRNTPQPLARQAITPAADKGFRPRLEFKPGTEPADIAQENPFADVRLLEQPAPSVSAETGDEAKSPNHPRAAMIVNHMPTPRPDPTQATEPPAPAPASSISPGGQSETARIPVHPAVKVETVAAPPAGPATTVVSASAISDRTPERPPLPQKQAAAEQELPQAVRQPAAPAATCSKPPVAAAPMPTGPSAETRKLLFIGLALLSCAAAGLIFSVRGRRQANGSSLISKSVHAWK
jgi:hypothetical protein